MCDIHIHGDLVALDPQKAYLAVFTVPADTTPEQREYVHASLSEYFADYPIRVLTLPSDMTVQFAEAAAPQAQAAE